MKKILSLSLIICCILSTFVGCKNIKNNKNNKLELEAALRLEKEGAWFGAYALLDDLIERGYYLEYAEKRDELYDKYFIVNAVHTAFSFRKLKQDLKDPSSLVIYNISITANKKESGSQPYDFDYYFEIVYDYGASNSFGGMVRSTVTSLYTDEKVQEYFEGKKIDYSLINLKDLAEMDDLYEWKIAKMEGDYELYSYKKWEVDGNIWWS